MYMICTTAQCFSRISQLVQVLSLLALNLQVLPNIRHQIPMAVECPILTWQIPKTVTQSRKKSQMGNSYSIPFNSKFLRSCNSAHSSLPGSSKYNLQLESWGHYYPCEQIQLEQLNRFHSQHTLRNFQLEVRKSTFQAMRPPV